MTGYIVLISVCIVVFLETFGDVKSLENGMCDPLQQMKRALKSEIDTHLTCWTIPKGLLWI